MNNEERILKLEDLLKHATDVIDKLVYEYEGKYTASYNDGTDITPDVKYVVDNTNAYFQEKQ